MKALPGSEPAGGAGGWSGAPGRLLVWQGGLVPVTLQAILRDREAGWQILQAGAPHQQGVAATRCLAPAGTVGVFTGILGIQVAFIAS